MAIDYHNWKGFHPDLNEGPVDTSFLTGPKGYRTSSLFCDATAYPSDSAIYSMREKNDRGLPSAYLIYMHSVDEYEAALKLVGSIAHWDKLMTCKWFTDPNKFHRGVFQWRVDMARRNASLGNKVLMRAARDGDASAARKILDNAEKELSAKAPVGRPASRKAKAAAEAAEKAGEADSAIKELHKQMRDGQE